MAAQNNRLGRGLASLIGDTATTAPKLPPEGEQRVVSIEQVKSSPLNPRSDFAEEDLQELAASIAEKGVVQPLIVRKSAGLHAGYEIVAGERRWRASQIAGLHTIPVIIRDLTDQELLELAIIENVQRADLNPIEEAAGYSQLVDEYSYTQDDLAKIIGKSRSHLANTMRLLKLPASVQSMVREGVLSAGHARALIGQEEAERLAELVVAKGLNVRAVEALIQGREERAAKPKPEKDADTRAVERELSDALGLKVVINPGSGESGELRVRYRSLEQLDAVRDRLLNMLDDAHY
ncbi:MAG: ParB/RepB/Spo0J family partition protein [Methyloligellaceae bacterium]